MLFPHDVVQFENPVIVDPDCCTAVQVKLLPVTVEFNDTLLALPLHIVCAFADPSVLF